MKIWTREKVITHIKRAVDNHLIPNFSNQNLDGLDLSDINFQKAVFTKTLLKSTDFSRANLEDCHFTQVFFLNTRTHLADFGHATILNSKLEDIHFYTRLINTKFINTKLDNVTFFGSTISYISFTNVYFYLCNFHGAILPYDSVSTIQLNSCIINKTTGLTSISGIDLNGETLYAFSPDGRIFYFRTGDFFERGLSSLLVR